ALCGQTDQASLVRERDDARGEPVAIGVRDDDRLLALHGGDHRVRRSQIDSYDLRHLCPPGPPPRQPGNFSRWLDSSTYFAWRVATRSPAANAIPRSSKTDPYSLSQNVLRSSLGLEPSARPATLTVPSESADCQRDSA